jgi:hypothetical protein
MMGDVFDMSTPDCKVLYMIAMLNELHIGDNGLNSMQELIKTKPNSDITEEEFAHKQATAREKAPKAAEYDITKTAGYREAMDDVKNGRVYHADSVDDMFKQILGEEAFSKIRSSHV